jgi:SAM-dependent methyltransferase
MSKDCYRSTIAWYDTHAAEYMRLTKAVDMSHLYQPALALIPPGGKILDAGAGSGRDAVYFKSQNYHVTAFDASPELGSQASQVLGQPVSVMDFSQVAYVQVFDLVWANASLLHLTTVDMYEAVARLLTALKPGGVFYFTLKEGSGAEIHDTKYYCYYRVSDIIALLQATPGIAVQTIWLTDDHLRRSRTTWINTLVIKELR